MTDMFIFGLGYSASYIRQALTKCGWRVNGTGGAGGLDFTDESAVHMALKQASHVLSCVPPADDLDPVLQTYGDALTHNWLGYLSSSGVYGDTGGAWVDESAAVGLGRRSVRAKCDAAWLDRGARIFRLPGIYGPGRSAFDRIAQNKARRIALPKQVFSRIHVADIASGVIAGLDGPAGAYNLSDDLPAPQNAVIEAACAILGVEPPPMQTLQDADLSPQALAFYAENRRVANGKAKRILGWKPQYPTYHSGLQVIAEERALSPK